MLTFFDRLDKYIKIKGLNDNKITIEANISNGLIGKGRKRGSLSQENISKILNTYSDLDANWLMTGNGEMLKIESVKKGDPNDIIHLQSKIISLQEENIKLQKENTKLKEENIKLNDLLGSRPEKEKIA